MTHRYFIAGTDTGVGKTYIAANLLAGLGQGHRVSGYIKPFQTGCRNIEGMLASADVGEVKGLLGGDVECHVLHAYELPACPYLAARKAGARIDVQSAVEWTRRTGGRYEVTVVEGAGGLMVPLTEGETILDFAVGVGYPIILVTANKLGCINHSLMSIHILKERGVDIKALVLNDLEPVAGDEAAEANAEIIAAFAPGIEIVRVKHGGDFNLR